MKKSILAVLLFVSASQLFGQPLGTRTVLTHADTLRGTYGPGRDWWDVTKYDLFVKFNIADSTISGCNLISVKVLKQGNAMQIDLQEPLVIDSIRLTGDKDPGPKYLDMSLLVKDGNAYFIPADFFTGMGTNAR